MATDGDKVAAAIIATGLANRNSDKNGTQDLYVGIYKQVLERIAAQAETKETPAAKALPNEVRAAGRAAAKSKPDAKQPEQPKAKAAPKKAPTRKVVRSGYMGD